MDDSWDPYIKIYKLRFPDDSQRLDDIQQNIHPEDHGVKRCVGALIIEDDRYLSYEISTPSILDYHVLYGTELPEEWDEALESYYESAEVRRDGLARARELAKTGLKNIVDARGDIGRWKGKGRA